MAARGDSARDGASAAGSRGSRGSTGGRGRPSQVATGSDTLTVAELYRGHARLTLLRDLALGELTHAEIARSMGPGIQVADIKDFATEYATEIAEVRISLIGELKDECAGLWIAKRANRIAELQDSYEDCRVVVDQMRGSTIPGQDIGSKRHQNILRSQLQIMRSVADELEPPRRSGPGRPAGNGDDEDERSLVHYVVELQNGDIASLT